MTDKDVMQKKGFRDLWNNDGNDNDDENMYIMLTLGWYYAKYFTSFNLYGNPTR